MKRVLVTGATGFVGRPCLSALAQRSFEVHALSRQMPPAVNSPGIHWHQVDLLENRRGWHELLEQVRPTHLLHLAWTTEHGKYWTAPDNLRWLAMSLEFVEAFARFGGQRIVAAGTCAEFDWSACGEKPGPAIGSGPATLYGRCKLALQQVLNEYAPRASLSYAWARYYFMYGPHENPRRLVPSITCALLNGKAAPCTHGRQIRDFLHVNDVAAATVALLDSQVQGPVDIASGTPVAVKDVISRIAAGLGREHLIQWGSLPAPPTDPAYLVGDPTRLRKEVAWMPHYDLDQGIAGTLEWWQAENDRRCEAA